jgi:hypothetical protein
MCQKISLRRSRICLRRESYQDATLSAAAQATGGRNAYCNLSFLTIAGELEEALRAAGRETGNGDGLAKAVGHEVEPWISVLIPDLGAICSPDRSAGISLQVSV